jgi:hypothetical protein
MLQVDQTHRQKSWRAAREDDPPRGSDLQRPPRPTDIATYPMAPESLARVPAATPAVLDGLPSRP